MTDVPLGVRRYLPPTASDDVSTSPPGAVEPGLTDRVLAEAEVLGFARAGVATVEPLSEAGAHLEQFRASGFAGVMHYLMTGRRDDPRALLPEARSAVVVALAYGEPGLVALRGPDGPVSGQVARYARGNDYHQVIKDKLSCLAERIAAFAGRPILARACVDTAPLLERELARRAGLGFQGKSTMLIAPGVGSYVLLGVLLVDVELRTEPDSRRVEGCGSCRACLDACPTAAFVGPYVLDARRCISYLTIEYEGTLPRELRPALGTRVFGCDVCQEVCPFNASPRPKPVAPELRPKPALEVMDLVALLELGSAGYRRLVRGTALKRASRTTLQRNAAVALGNTGDPRAVRPLTRALRSNTRAIVRAHAAWALGALHAHLDHDAREALRAAAATDDDAETREEAKLALARAREAAH